MTSLSDHVQTIAESLGYKFMQVVPNDVNFQLKMKELTDDEYCVIMYPSTKSMQVEGGRFNGRYTYNAQIIELCKKSEVKNHVTTRSKLDETYEQKLENRLTQMSEDLETFLYSCFECSAKTMEVKSCEINDYINRYAENVDGLLCRITIDVW